MISWKHHLTTCWTIIDHPVIVTFFEQHEPFRDGSVFDSKVSVEVLEIADRIYHVAKKIWLANKV